METQCCSCSIHGKYKYYVCYQVFLHRCSFKYFILSHRLILKKLLYSKKTSSKKQPDFMNQSWEKILIGKNYSWIFLILLTFDKTQWFSFSNFSVSFYHEKHFERFRNCTGKFVRFLYNDIAKRGSGRADEKNWKGNFFLEWFLWHRCVMYKYGPSFSNWNHIFIF